MLHKCTIITVIAGSGYETTAPGGGRQSRGWWAVGLEDGRGASSLSPAPLPDGSARSGPPSRPTQPHAGAESWLLRQTRLLAHLRFGSRWRRPGPRGLAPSRPCASWTSPRNSAPGLGALPGGSAAGSVPARWLHDPLSRGCPACPSSRRRRPRG